MGYNENPMMVDKKFSVINAGARDVVDESSDVINKKKGIEKTGSPLSMKSSTIGAVGKVAAGLANFIPGVGPLVSAGLSAGTDALVAKKAGEEQAAIDNKVAETKSEQDKLKANTTGTDISAGGYGTNTTPTGGSGMGAVNQEDELASLLADPAATQKKGYPKKLGEVKPSYTNLKQSALEYNKSIAMMTISGASSLEKKGCYKPK
tara:strand:+ start:1218 stop:1835 length:618 start_codon:yes stop_codon:yes gene_type:complete